MRDLPVIDEYEKAIAELESWSGHCADAIERHAKMEAALEAEFAAALERTEGAATLKRDLAKGDPKYHAMKLDAAETYADMHRWKLLVGLANAKVEKARSTMSFEKKLADLERG